MTPEPLLSWADAQWVRTRVEAAATSGEDDLVSLRWARNTSVCGAAVGGAAGAAGAVAGSVHALNAAISPETAERLKREALARPWRSEYCAMVAVGIVSCTSRGVAYEPSEFATM